MAKKRRITEDDKAQAKTMIREAFAHAGLIQGNDYVCPACMKAHSKKGTLSIRERGTWKCFSSDEGGDAISVIQEAFGFNFPKAVNFLLGRDDDEEEAPKPKPLPEKLPEIQPDRPDSEIDPEVYRALLEYSGDAGREAAAEYFGHWYISREAVLESEASVVLDTKAMEHDMTERFGIQRLKDCGLVVETKYGNYFLCNKEYPVIEPHITPKGMVVGMQFRASHEQRKKVDAHEEYKKAKERGDTSVPEAKYVPKFLSLSGIDNDQSLIGFGLGRIWQAPPNTIIRVVEGFKDYLAARTMGHEAFGIPGTSSNIGPKVMDLLRPHRIAVALDGDEAGMKAQEELVGRFHSAQVRAKALPMPDGMDVTDILVKRHTDHQAGA